MPPLKSMLQGQYAFGLTGEVDSLYGCSAVLPITEEFARKYALVLVLSNLVRQLTISLSQKCVLSNSVWRNLDDEQTCP